MQSNGAKRIIYTEKTVTQMIKSIFLCINVRKRFANGLFQNEMHLLIGALTQPFEKSRTVWNNCVKLVSNLKGPQTIANDAYFQFIQCLSTALFTKPINHWILCAFVHAKNIVLERKYSSGQRLKCIKNI